MPEKVRYAFDLYFKQGITRTLWKLYYELVGNSHFDGFEPAITVLQDWATQYKWSDEVKRLEAEVYEQSKKEVQDEMTRAARSRIEKARTMMDAGAVIVDRAMINELDPISARTLLPTAKALIETGAKIERLELGEKTENFDPPKPIESMTDTELEDYLAKIKNA